MANEFGPDNLIASVLEIQRMSTEDGPGLRTTVFMKGCPLKCLWCHNPESISPKTQVHWIAVRCLGKQCRSCIDVCPDKALSSTPDGIHIDRELCKGCGKCAEECPSTALEMIGRQWKVNDLIEEVLKDRAFFEKSDEGGITVSGGEPTMQSQFVAAFLKGLKERGIHTALDTCGTYTKASINQLLPFTDLVLHDIKEIDPQKHKTFTGSSNKTILDNLAYVCDVMKTKGVPKKIWVRTPIIPL